MTDKRKAYEEKFDAQLKEWSAQIVLLNAKADKAKAEVKVEYYKTIENLQGKQDAARTKFLELRTVGDDAWDDIKHSTALRRGSNKAETLNVWAQRGLYE
jgi:hypothetical protein